MGYSPGLTFAALRAANQARMPMFKNAKGETQHSGRDWTPNDWLVATFGEIGEAANLLKKVRRGDVTIAEMRPKLAREFSDVVIYLDMLATECSVALHMVIPVETFVDFRMANRHIAARRRVEMNYTPTLNDRMVQCIACIGKVASALEEVFSQQAFMFDVSRQLAEQLHGVLYFIDTLADECGINLGSAVIETFNAKSDQLELDLYITPHGFVRGNKV